MTTELEAILDSQLVTNVFDCGSAAMLIISLAVVIWISRSREPRTVLRACTAS